MAKNLTDVTLSTNRCKVIIVMMKKRLSLLIAIGFFGLALYYRGFFAPPSQPFWVDEFSTAFQANLVRQYTWQLYQQSEYYVEYHNLIPHILVALSFQAWGESTWAARFPFIILGSLVPAVLWWYGAHSLRSPRLGAVAALLTSFHYWQITWSQQARGYALQQLLVVLLLIVYTGLQRGRGRNWWGLVALGVIITFGVLTHFTFSIWLAALILHAGWQYRHSIPTWWRRQPWLLVAGGLLVGCLLWFMAAPSWRYFQYLLAGNLVNNLGYYHSFFWREQTLVTSLAIIGFAYGLHRYRQLFSYLLLVVTGYLVFFGVVFEPRVTRYFLPILPVFLIAMALAIREVSDHLTSLWLPTKSGQRHWLQAAALVGVPLLVTLIIIANGDLFSLRPRSYYSLNRDFREIANINYDQVYQLITAKGQLDQERTAVIDTWADRTAWYLGRSYPHTYVFRWPDGLELLKQTNYITTADGQKMIWRRPGVGFISSRADLEQVMARYPRGFLWIDDSSLPAEVLAYARQNLKTELTLERNPLDENPYSVWPGTLYSWGIEP